MIGAGVIASAAASRGSVAQAAAGGGGGGVTPLRQFDPDNYSVAGTFIADSRDTWDNTSSLKPFVTVEDVQTADISLEVGVSGGGYGGRSNVMRYNLPQAGDGSTVISYTTSRKFALGYQISEGTQVWWEVFMRHHSDFRASLSWDGAAPNGGGFKYILTSRNGAGRYDHQLVNDSTNLTLATPSNVINANYAVPDPTAFSDELWHRFRATVLTDPTSGVYKVWIDDSVLLDFVGNTGTVGTDWYSIGPANSNYGWKRATWMDVGLINFYTTDPGW